jgi:hypothetical protein
LVSEPDDGVSALEIVKDRNGSDAGDNDLFEHGGQEAERASEIGAERGSEA